MRRISPYGLKKLKEWEGLRLSAYRDSANVLTIGYGHTSAAGKPKVQAGMKITQTEAETILLDDLEQYEADVERLVKVPLNDNQFAALVSFHFNTGALGKSTLLKKLNAGDYEAVPYELNKWVFAGKKRIQGLVNRRAAEIGLWSKGAPIANSNAEAERKKPPMIDKESASWGAGILASLASLFEGHGVVQYAIAAIMVVAFGIGAYLYLTKRLRTA